jgi:hypothetical protein
MRFREQTLILEGNRRVIETVYFLFTSHGCRCGERNYLIQGERSSTEFFAFAECLECGAKTKPNKGRKNESLPDVMRRAFRRWHDLKMRIERQPKEPIT